MADGKYEQSAVASLTVIIPWYRHCQMERTSRWTVSAEGKWYNGKADGEFVDVPTHRRRAKKKPPGAPARRLVPNRSQSAAAPRGICPHIRHSSGANPLPPCSRRRRCRARAPRHRSSCCWSTFTSTLTYPSRPPPPPPPPSPVTTPIAMATSISATILHPHLQQRPPPPHWCRYDDLEATLDATKRWANRKRAYDYVTGTGTYFASGFEHFLKTVPQPLPATALSLAAPLVIPSPPPMAVAPHFAGARRAADRRRRHLHRLPRRRRAPALLHDGAGLRAGDRPREHRLHPEESYAAARPGRAPPPRARAPAAPPLRASTHDSGLRLAGLAPVLCDSRACGPCTGQASAPR